VTKITNGYGGATEYWYSGGSNGARYSHLQKTYDGLGGVSVRTTESSGACYDSVGSGCRQRNDGLFGPSDGLVGFGEVRETVREGSESGTVLRAVQHRMYTDYTKAGREYETRVLEPVGTTVDWTAGVVESQVQTQFLEQIGTQYGVSSMEV